MSSVSRVSLNPESQLVQDGEQQLLEQLVNKAQEAGLKTDRNATANLYVALKSKPMALLVGPPGSGKSAIVRCLAEVLTGGNPLQGQLMAGHAWWAEQTGNVGQFATGQARFNDQKLLSIIEEALQPENHDMVHLACLAWISAAELFNVFTDLSTQIQTRIHRLSTIRLQRGLPYPPNLLLLGTMDATTEPEISAELYAHTTLVWWTANGTQQLLESSMFPSHNWNRNAGQGKTFLTSAVREESLAWEKLTDVVGWKQIDLRVWRTVRALFHKHGYDVPDAIQVEGIIYLANAWDGQGRGLFVEDMADNLSIALDFVLAQMLLPRMRPELRESPQLAVELDGFVGNRLPRSSSWLNAWRRSVV